MKIIKNEQLNLSRLLRGIKNGWLLLGLFLLVGLPAHSQLPTSPHPDPNWNLNWSEDFTPDSLYPGSNYINSSKWISEYNWYGKLNQLWYGGKDSILHGKDSPDVAYLAPNFANISFVQLSPTNWAAQMKTTRNTSIIWDSTVFNRQHFSLNRVGF